MGQMSWREEPKTHADFYLYLPKTYKTSGPRHPVVVTFHGMAPFDTAGRQIREWQQEADRYGFIVVAPGLKTPVPTSPLHLQSVTNALKRDEEATVAILEYVLRTTNADPRAVLSTSWSYGGYLAHYMLNRHPDRFTCLAVRESTFSADILEEAALPRYRSTPIAIFSAEHDLGNCYRESQDAAVWYSRHGFDVTYAEFADIGHRRTPGPVAAFFAKECGALPFSPPGELVDLRVKRPEVLIRFAGLGQRGESGASERQQEDQPVPKINSSDNLRRESQGVRPTELTSVKGQPRVSTGRPSIPPSLSPGSELAILVEPPIEVSPVLVRFEAVLPEDARVGADYLWFLNGEPLGNGPGGRKILTDEGDYHLEVRVTDRWGRQLRAEKVVTVLEPFNR